MRDFERDRARGMGWSRRLWVCGIDIGLFCNKFTKETYPQPKPSALCKYAIETQACCLSMLPPNRLQPLRNPSLCIQSQAHQNLGRQMASRLTKQSLALSLSRNTIATLSSTLPDKACTLRMSTTSSALRTKEAATKSTPCWQPKVRSSLSLSVSAGRVIFTPGVREVGKATSRQGIGDVCVCVCVE